ncbi:MAG TPA: HAD-IA family hydrolase [Candidatus Limnocylindria bacterium]
MSTPLSLPRPAAVILDLDGTLVDTVETRIRAWLAVFADYDIPASHGQLAPLIGSDGRFLARRVSEEAGIRLPDGRDEEIDRRAGEIYERLNREPRPLPGVRELIEVLDGAGVRWAIATSSRREQVGTSVRALALDSEPVIVDGSHVEHAKPEPDLLLLAARELGTQPADCWYVGDSTWDMQAAVNAGMVAVAVVAGAAVSSDELTAAGARAVLPDLQALARQI